MTNNTETKTGIDSSIAPKLVEWFKAGRGVRKWVSAEIGNPRPDQFTPGDVETPPHWAYPVADSQLLTPDMLELETFTPRIAYNGKLAKSYWGLHLSKTSEAKARRLCQPGETWNWIYKNYGVCEVQIGKLVRSPFIVEG